MSDKITASAKLSRNMETDEWIVKTWDEDGKRTPNSDYFTNDKEDAVQTMEDMFARWQTELHLREQKEQVNGKSHHTTEDY